VARCLAGDDSPELIAPPEKKWKRHQIVEWLKTELTKGKRLLIGFDFAFSLPFESVGYLGGRIGILPNARALWHRLEIAARGESDFGCSAIVSDPLFAPSYWTKGKKPIGWKAVRRQTENECAQFTGAHPESVFKLIGSKQVGKASLTGMRVFQMLRTQNDGTAVWPFDSLAGKQAVFVEIFPTIFRKLASGRLEKLRDLPALNTSLKRLNSALFDTTNPVSDDETDAILSAAGLRFYTQSALFPLDELDSIKIAREGWIFGVPVLKAKNGADGSSMRS
jgi:hypothetical protein